MSDLSSVRQEEGRSLTRFLCLQTRLEDAPQAPVVGGGRKTPSPPDHPANGGLASALRYHG